MLHAEFDDARLVSVYDAEYSWSRDDDFFLSVVDETPGSRVLDLGCGTGRLALGLAAAGHTVTGVDPAAASVAAARAKPGADGVTWVDGTSADLPTAVFDVAVMTGHVAQFFVEDTAWRLALADLRRSLLPGGRLVFDTRDPRGRRWERWNPADSRRSVALPDGSVVEVWTEVTEVRDSVVGFTHHYTLPGGEVVRSTARLRFRDEGELRGSLSEAGFAVERLYGGFGREAVGAGDGELLVIARAVG
ncbi:MULTISPECIES: class I SAM-dependent methyltransferase [unclassified Streptomyces]|uniref:class I SAM-dependent methyltransferase n=1 Tax=unclassified Streptomyces TaxID=2593676 RepID=UPI000CD574BB|nr:MULTISPECIES: class I SAM-dependent methyltransferase [unclassified Streptomyces]